ALTPITGPTLVAALRSSYKMRTGRDLDLGRLDPNVNLLVCNGSASRGMSGAALASADGRVLGVLLLGNDRNVTWALAVPATMGKFQTITMDDWTPAHAGVSNLSYAAVDLRDFGPEGTSLARSTDAVHVSAELTYSGELDDGADSGLVLAQARLGLDWDPIVLDNAREVSIFFPLGAGGG